MNLTLPLFDLAGGVVSGSVSTDYGNRGYMQTWYGVSPEQAARTGFAQHKPKAGLVSAGLGLKWSHRVGRNGNWYISAEGTRLLGDAADSPIVQKANQFGLMSGYTHRF
ncbi:MltA-interacting MipA family protein [Stenotrophomonas maltophilia]|nr:MltA-interacting MipA family protein [Stenotrophomonas maltophilia]